MIFDDKIPNLKRLNVLRRKCISEKTTPRYDGLCRNLSNDEIESKEEAGEKCVIRFKFDPGQWEFRVSFILLKLNYQNMFFL